MKLNRHFETLIGRFLYRQDKTGHSLLCRVLHGIANCGPHATFVCVDTIKLEYGGHLCSFGVRCGAATEDYVRQRNETMEEFRRITEMLLKSGELQAHVWENPRFSAASLCECGRKDDRMLPNHDPLCPYRIEHHQPITVDEYKSAIGRMH